ncbi:hypothetical protein BDA96_03G448000 [Sorghum bicolor]|uniref:Uncharacterized protein n=1 Tax=Sorghum bicolor TaxID=4558 RepID=A0A921RIF7_SORBI|nr:hypothetical protein BDA96_03G448000 [Sorghum bicolor]
MPLCFVSDSSTDDPTDLRERAPCVYRSSPPRALSPTGSAGIECRYIFPEHRVAPYSEGLCYLILCIVCSIEGLCYYCTSVTIIYPL